MKIHQEHLDKVASSITSGGDDAAVRGDALVSCRVHFMLSIDFALNALLPFFVLLTLSVGQIFKELAKVAALPATFGEVATKLKAYHKLLDKADQV